MIGLPVLGLLLLGGHCKSPDMAWRMEAEAYLDEVEVSRPFSTTSTRASLRAFLAAEQGYKDFNRVVANEPVLNLLTGKGPCLGDYLSVLTCPPFRACQGKGLFDRIAEVAPPSLGLLAGLRAAQMELLLAYTVSEAYLTHFEEKADMRSVVCRLAESVQSVRDQSLADARIYLADALRLAQAFDLKGPTTDRIQQCAACLDESWVGQCVTACELNVPELSDTRACLEAWEPY